MTLTIPKSCYSFFIALISLCFSFSVFAKSIDCETAKNLQQDNRNRQQVLVKILANFEQLKAGAITQSFSLPELFVVNLDDEQSVQARIKELSVGGESVKTDYRLLNKCDVSIADLESSIAYRQELEESVRTMRLAFLKRPYVERKRVLQILLRLGQLSITVAEQDKMQQALDDTNNQNIERAKVLETKANAEVDAIKRKQLFQQVFDLKPQINQALELIKSVSEWRKITQSQAEMGSRLLVMYMSNKSVIEQSNTFITLWQTIYLDKLHIPQALNDNEAHWRYTLLAFDWYLDADYHNYFVAQISNNQHELYQELKTNVGFYSLIKGELNQLLRYSLAGFIVPWYDFLSTKPEQNNYLALFDFYTPILIEIISALVIFLILILLVSRLPQALHKRQLLNMKIEDASKLDIVEAYSLRFLKPNSVWLSVYVMAFFITHSGISYAVFISVLVILMSLFYQYQLLMIISNWLISRMHYATQVIMSSIQHKKLLVDVKIWAVSVLVLVSVNQLIKHQLTVGYIQAISSTFSIVLIWYFSAILLKKYQVILYTFVNLHVKNIYQKLPFLSSGVVSFLVAPFLFIISQTLDFLLALHSKLLVFEIYQRLNVKLLKIRLEQLQQQDDNKSIEVTPVNDSYERWFSDVKNKDMPFIELKGSVKPELDKIVRSWLVGKNEENDLLISGFMGSGKSTLIQQWKQEWTECTVEVVVIKEKITTSKAFFHILSDALSAPDINNIEDIKLYDQALNEDIVIVIEQAENLFLADEGGFEAYKAMLDCISIHVQHIFWIIVSSKKACDYLKLVFINQQAFSYQLNLAKWSQQEIRQLIMDRHQASRRQLIFDDLLLTGMSTENNSAILAAETRCFNLLWDQSGGVPSIAMALWVNAANKAEPFGIKVGVPERPSVNLFKSYNDQMLFVYAAIVMHENLTVNQVINVTNLSSAIVRYALKVGHDIGFIDINKQGVCTISALWYIQIILYLNQRNFLHE